MLKCVTYPLLQPRPSPLTSHYTPACSRAQVAKRELALECDYTYEAAAQQRFKGLVEGDVQLRPHFHVPATIPELCAGQVLTSEWVQGVAIDQVGAGCMALGALAAQWGGSEAGQNGVGSSLAKVHWRLSRVAATAGIAWRAVVTPSARCTPSAEPRTPP